MQLLQDEFSSFIGLLNSWNISSFDALEFVVLLLKNTEMKTEAEEFVRKKMGACSSFDHASKTLGYQITKQQKKWMIVFKNCCARQRHLMLSFAVFS